MFEILLNRLRESRDGKKDVEEFGGWKELGVEGWGSVGGGLLLRVHGVG